MKTGNKQKRVLLVMSSVDEMGMITRAGSGVSMPSFEDRPLPAITIADQNWWGGGSRPTAGQGEAQVGMTGSQRWFNRRWCLSCLS